MILADSSVWVEHFRIGNATLAQRLLDGEIAGHPFIIGELACGGIARRAVVLADLRALPQVDCVEHDEVLALIENRRLHGRGLGWTDAHLLAAALMSGFRLWTLDRSLRAAAVVLGVHV